MELKIGLWLVACGVHMYMCTWAYERQRDRDSNRLCIKGGNPEQVT